MFKPDQLFMILDYETYSEADLRKVGSWEYSVHKSTEVLCVSFRVGTLANIREAEVHTYAPLRPWNEHRHDLRKGKLLASYLKDKNVIVAAHNALFEQAITRNVLPKHLGNLLGPKPFIIPHDRFVCTAVLSSIYALPRSLDGVTSALGLDHQKDKEGHRLMLKWSKPRKPTKNNPATRQEDPAEFDRLVEYCEHDIYAETEVLCVLPPMIDSERALWLFDQEINFRGVKVDRDLVKLVLKMIEQEKKIMTKELQDLTKGQVLSGGQTAAIHKWLIKRGCPLDDMTAKTVDDAIKSDMLPPDVQRVLILRQGLNKTSLKKYTAFLNHTASDDRMRFSLNFNATVHGRWGGAGVQPHNFPRGSLKYKDQDGKEHDLAPFAAELMKDGADLEFIRSQFGNPIEVFVSCLRTMIIPDDEHELFVSDFSAIEARVLFWLANHEDGVKAFVENRKMYEELAMIIFNRKRMEDVLKDERFVGKQAFLGSGYGMGWKKFMKTCQDFGQEVTVEVAKKAIEAYREKHAPVVALWNNLEKAAIKAVENPGKTYKINNTKWYMEGDFLVCQLPSGRCLHYYGAKIKYERTPWGQSKANLYHWTVDSKTKKWTFTKTWGGVLTQNCVGGISRDLLAASMVRVKENKFTVLLTVHDEVVAQRKKGFGDEHTFHKLMAMTPEWAKGCPVAAEGYKDSRYHK
jgi:DNA polymerase